MPIYKAPAKVNVFLKITGKRGNYHEILSRFILVPPLYDTLQFGSKRTGAPFEIEGDFSCAVEQNTIYKAYVALVRATESDALIRFFDAYNVTVRKRIPAFAGLGGGSSDAATFLRMCNDTLALGLETAELARIGAEVGADVPFFVYGYPSANVSGIGEIVEPFDETPPFVETCTPRIAVSTPAVYTRFRAAFYKELSPEMQAAYRDAPSRELLASGTAESLNDLYAPACALYPDLTKLAKPGWFFSGSGSSFFYRGSAIIPP